MWADMLLVDLNHPRPTNQHRRQIPGPIRFHGGRKCRRRQRLELRTDWYNILLIGDGGIALKTLLMGWSRLLRSRLIM
uniref:Uncharacterized protein n=1 Tax=Brassica oleracea TaxID=3712 RepID=A0A3P6FDB4_BRAOL|nr:unnamed protein product [Brassica oleracea]